MELHASIGITAKKDIEGLLCDLFNDSYVLLYITLAL